MHERAKISSSNLNPKSARMADFQIGLGMIRGIEESHRPEYAGDPSGIWVYLDNHFKNGALYAEFEVRCPCAY